MAEPIHLSNIAAHFDGEHIVLDEPIDLPAGASLRLEIVGETVQPRPGSPEAVKLFLDWVAKSAPLGDARLPQEQLEDRDLYY